MDCPQNGTVVLKGLIVLLHSVIKSSFTIKAKFGGDVTGAQEEDRYQFHCPFRVPEDGK